MFEPLARWRQSVVTYGWIATDPADSAGDAAGLASGPDRGKAPQRPRYWSWAALMHRAFETDVLACPHCGSRMRLIATVHDPHVIRQILAHLGLTHAGQSPGPARAQRRPLSSQGRGVSRIHAPACSAAPERCRPLWPAWSRPGS